jgi:hypothetical protein
MRNLVLGILVGIGGACLYFMGGAPPWYVWVLYAAGAASIVFSFDVLFGSIEEHEPRAAVLGFGTFLIPGTLLMGAVLKLGF